jgi:decaprenylphospho-beta-D-erythro-pentofuranosid-2-ulose 2-reductase
MNIIIIGATSEIAKEVGRIYADKKNNFMLIGRDSTKLVSIKSDYLAREAIKVLTHVADLDDSRTYQEVFEICSSTFNHIDLLIIAHGTLPDQLLVENNFSQVEAYARTNFISYISLLTLFAEKFELQKSGSIAVFSSVAGDRGRRSNYIYGSFKAGIQAFLDGFGARMARAGVHVLDIRPGMVDSPMTSHLKKGFLFASSEKVAKDIVKAIAKKKYVLYTPFFWRYIMLIIKTIPKQIFNKLNF